MLTITVATPFRKRQRRQRRNTIAIARGHRTDRNALPAPDPRTTVVVWSDPDTRHSDFDLDLATWEDAEWR